MFGWIVTIFDIILYQPLFNALIFLYNVLPGHDFGVAIIALTIIIRVILYPLAIKAIQSQKVMQELQPKLQEIQKKYKDDKEKQAQETLELYRQEKVNPFSGLLLSIIQLPILIALYRVFWGGLNPKELSQLYHFVANPGTINAVFVHLVNLSKPNVLFALIAGVVQFFQTKMLLPKPTGERDMATRMQQQMVYFFPVITINILFRLPSALSLYWIASGVFSVAQQYLILRNSSAKTKTT